MESLAGQGIDGGDLRAELLVAGVVLVGIGEVLAVVLGVEGDEVALGHRGSFPVTVFQLAIAFEQSEHGVMMLMAQVHPLLSVSRSPALITSPKFLSDISAAQTRFVSVRSMRIAI
jgi:hypothetical protein